ncbi:MAG: DUF1330 domain-containing protein [Myxococcota bacterium]
MKLAMGPEPDQIEELMSGPADTPVVMVNLLRFKERADVPGEDIPGAESYLRYAARMRRIVEGAGGRFIWSGRVDSQVIGRSDVPFDVIGLVEYPSREAFLATASSPEVREIGGHRAAGLEGQWLIATTENA